MHPDHLGSTNVVTDENDALVQTLDYYPYGATRVSVSTSTNEKRKYINQFSDDSGLSYLNARYMDPSRGQFNSEEPIFLNIGDVSQVRQLAQQDQQTYLTDPQALNSYSYGRDNPITRKDPNGRQAVAVAGLAPVLGIEALSGPVGWTALGLTTVVSGAYMLSNLGEPNLQTTISVSGQGYDADPRLPPKPPKGPWGMLFWTSAVTATGIVGFNEYFGPVLKPDNGLQPLRWPNGTSSVFPGFAGGNGPIFTLPPIVFDKSGTAFYRNSSGLLSTTPQQNGSASTNKSNGSGGPQPSNGKTPITGSGGTVHYCLGVCYQRHSGRITFPSKYTMHFNGEKFQYL